MSYKFYKTWFALNEITELSNESIHGMDFYYRFFYESQLKSYVGQRFLNGRFDLVYYNGQNLESISAYHRKKFADIKMFQVIKNISGSSILSKIYLNNEFQGMELYNYNSIYQYTRSLKFDNNYQLVEYREATYTPSNTLQKDKIFIPSLWQTFEEDY